MSLILSIELKPGDLKSDMKKTEEFLAASKKCGLKPGDFYNLYGVLSHDIHGYPWSGNSVKVLDMSNTAYVCFIKELAALMSLDVVVSNQ